MIIVVVGGCHDLTLGQLLTHLLEGYRIRDIEHDLHEGPIAKPADALADEQGTEVTLLEAADELTFPADYPVELFSDQSHRPSTSSFDATFVVLQEVRPYQGMHNPELEIKLVPTPVERWREEKQHPTSPNKANRRCPSPYSLQLLGRVK